MNRSRLASSVSLWFEKLTRRRIDFIIAVVCVVMFLAQLLAAQVVFHQSGFPLDDSWIYQVYARNLAHSGQWAFVQGTPSTGSTSILWTIAIAPAYLLRVDGPIWTLLLGLLMQIAAALGASRFAPSLASALSLALGLAVGVQWQIVWAATSGMETIAFSALLIWFWVWIQRQSTDGRLDLRSGLALGLWGGILLLARPEGILTAGMVGFVWLFRPWSLTARAQWASGALAGLCIIVLPFFALNLLTSGSIWPNTFYAKQTEYAELWSSPYIARFANQAGISLVGPQVILVPGLIIWIVTSLRGRQANVSGFLPLLWVVAHWALYAARLPVVYQHGRYAIPVISILIIMSLLGIAGFVKPFSGEPIHRFASLTWIGVSVISFPLFTLVVGVPAYARDIAFINHEMVSTASWVRDNTMTGDRVAVHDIGALGYFAPRKLVDLAGLISPEVIPVMTDGEKLADFVVEKNADYLIVFPRWSLSYQTLVADERFCKIWSADLVNGYQSMSDLGPLTVYRVMNGEPCIAP
jgi:hypothetical protein